MPQEAGDEAQNDRAQVWILGATGRIGHGVLSRMAERGVVPILVGRESARLREAAAEYGAPVIIADGPDDIANEISQRRPAVVVNTIGNYAETGPMIARACMPGGRYVDLAADLISLPRLLDLNDEAATTGSVVVTGAGFGVLAAESVVVHLCAGEPVPARVRVDALGSVAGSAGAIGSAFATSIVDAVSSGSSAFRNGRLVDTRLGEDGQTLTLPDGQLVFSAGAPAGELIAAQLASGAPDVTFTTALAPSSRIVRAVMPVLRSLLSIALLRRLTISALSRMKTKETARPRQHSWGHAVIYWPDGTTKEGWLRADDGMDFTADVATEVAMRLSRNEAEPGAYTPARAFGSEVAIAAGGTLTVEQ